MPNGDLEFDIHFPEYEAFFAPILNIIGSFDSQYNLGIEKYYHDAPVWSLLFRHTAGGVAKIDLCKDKEFLHITKIRWYDNYAEGMRSVKSDSFTSIPVKQSLVLKKLTSALNEILLWEFNDWDSSYSGHKKNWHCTWLKMQFFELEKQYPLPNIQITQ